MKLFQRLLVAPAALGLISPLAANATEVNLNEISNYSDVDNIEVVNTFDTEELDNSPLLAGGEGLVDSFSPDGSFSSTTTASFSADFAVGYVDGKGIKTGVTDGDEDVQAVYGFQIDLNTSFTGEDSLDVSIDAGNAASTSPLAEFDLNGPATTGTSSSADDILTVDGVSYTFPLGDKATVIVGDNTDGSALFTIACAYGGPSNTLDDCGAPKAGITGGGATLGASYDIGGGFSAAVGFQFVETGIATKENNDTYAVNVAYTGDSYGASVTYASYEDGTNGVDTDYYTAFNGYWTPEGFPSISAGYEVGTIGGVNNTADEALAYFVGISTELGAGEFGAAVGTQGSYQEAVTTDPNSEIKEELMYEAYYSYPVNDGMTITPLIYMKEKITAGTPDETGVMVKTSFSF